MAVTGGGGEGLAAAGLPHLSGNGCQDPSREGQQFFFPLALRNDEVLSFMSTPTLLVSPS
jgi:hypothetical protein